MTPLQALGKLTLAILAGLSAAFVVLCMWLFIGFGLTFGHPNGFWAQGVGQWLDVGLMIGLPFITFCAVTYFITKQLFPKTK